MSRIKFPRWKFSAIKISSNRNTQINDVQTGKEHDAKSTMPDEVVSNRNFMGSF